MLLCPQSAHADVRPNSLFTPGAVLQRGRRIPIWGTAREGERVTVEFNNKRSSAVAKDGKWMTWLKPLQAGGPYTLKISSDNTVEVPNVLVGEVWICSGQSNMQMDVSGTADAAEVIAGANDSQIRLFTVPRKPSGAPLTNVDAAWQDCTPQTLRGFSAVAYAFGRELRRSLKVPVGLISTNYGGTPAEAWTRSGVLESDLLLRENITRQAAAQDAYAGQLLQYPKAMAAYRLAVERAIGENAPPPRAPLPPQDPAKSPNQPAGLYNAMIAPLIPYAIRGAIWYQGESNAGRAWEYRKLFPAMIHNWREDWGQGDFPFLFVQLAPFLKIDEQPTESAWAELREAQLLTLTAEPNTGMAVITDIGDQLDIHPKQKTPVGQRLALAARALAYKDKMEYSGPVYELMRVDRDRVILRFKHVGGGLEARGGPLTGFSIAGKDRKFVNAQAEIVGDTVVVTSPSVPEPGAVRFGWSNFPVVNLYNKAGLPATPFRTDDFPMVTAPKR